jgi:hypothetical protein
MSDRYVIKCEGGSPVQCLTERQALRRAAELLDRNGPNAEIEIYLNELSADSILYSRAWMRHRVTSWTSSAWQSRSAPY